MIPDLFAVAAPSFLGSIPAPPTDRLEAFGLSFRFYGLTIALGVLAAVEISRRRWEARGGDADDIFEIAKWSVPAGLLGARAYHVLTDWTSYQGRWLDAFAIWKGGLGIPGGLLVGVGVGVWYARRRGWDVTALSHCIIPGIPVAQAIGRLGNWFNQEVFGGPTDLPWALEVDGLDETVHPTFLYEGLWNLGLAAFLIWADRTWLKRGQMLPLWIMGYGVGRFWVESIRVDPATEIAGIRVNHWVSAVAVLIGLAWFVWAGRRADQFDESDRVDEPDDGDESDLGVDTANVEAE